MTVGQIEVRENLNVILDYGLNGDDTGILKERQKRAAPIILLPAALWGIRVAPSVFKALVKAYGLASVLAVGIEEAAGNRKRNKSE